MSVNCLIFAGNSETLYGRHFSVGPYRIATELRNRGYTVQVVDLSMYETFTGIHELVLNKFVGSNTLWIGFSVNFLSNVLGWPKTDTPDRLKYLKQKNQNLDLEIKKFTKYAKDINPNVQFLIGGVRIIDLEHLGFYHFRGYADESIVKFTDSLCRGNKPKKKIYEYDLYDNFVNSKTHFLENDILKYYKSLSIEISRGCIFKCKFCSYPLNGKTKGEWIKKSHILREEFLLNYEKYGVTDYVFSDDTFNDSPKKLEILYDEVFSRLPFKISFSSYLRLDLLYRYPHTLDILKESGLDACFFGIETLNKKAAKIIGKGMDPQLQIEFIRKIKSEQFKDIDITSGWIFGLPTDTKQSLIESAEWLLSKQNPIEHNRITWLGLKYPKSYKRFTSTFEDEAESYGINIFLDEEKNTQWSYKNEELTSQWCERFSNEIYNLELKTWKDKKIQVFHRGSYINLGVSSKDIKSLTREQIEVKYDIKNTTTKMNLLYLKNLLSI